MKKIASELISVFHSDSPVDLEEIRQAIRSGDGVAAVEHVHRLKGSAAQVGGESLRRQCADAEQLFQNGERTGWLAALETLEKELAGLRRELKQWLEAL